MSSTTKMEAALHAVHPCQKRATDVLSELVQKDVTQHCNSILDFVH